MKEHVESLSKQILSSAKPSFVWRDEYTMLVLAGAVLLGLALGIILAVSKFYVRREARTYVINTTNVLTHWFSSVEALLKDPSIDQTIRPEIETMGETLSYYQQLTHSSPNVDWIQERRALRHFRIRVRDMRNLLQHQIDYAAKARNEGPSLFQDFPTRLDLTKEKLEIGTRSDAAFEYLERAQQQYQVVITEYNRDTINWLAWYPRLLTAQSYLERAEETHNQINDRHLTQNSSYS